MLLTISVTVIAAILLVVVLFLIPVLLQIRRTASEAEKLVNAARAQVVPLGHDITIITQEVKGILESVHRQVDKLQEGTAAVSSAAVSLRDFQREVQERIQGPLLKFVGLFGAVTRGMFTFFRVFRR